MNWRVALVALLIVSIISAYGGYKYASSFATKHEETKVKFVEVQNKDVRTERRIESPDGTVETIITEDKSVIRTKGKKRSEVKIEALRPKWRVGVQKALSPEPDLFGANLSRRVLGNLWVGVYARTDQEVGLSISYDF